MTQHRDFTSKRTTLRRKSSWVFIVLSFIFPFAFLWVWVLSFLEPDHREKVAKLVEEELENKYGPSNYEAYPNRYKQPKEFEVLDYSHPTFQLLRESSLLFSYPPLRAELDEYFILSKPLVDQWYSAMENGAMWQSQIDPLSGTVVDFLFIQQISNLYEASAINHAKLGNWELAFNELNQGRKFNSPLLSGPLISHLIYQSNLSSQVTVLEEMIRWNPSDEVLLQISEQLDEIASLNKPIPEIAYISDLTILQHYPLQYNSTRISISLDLLTGFSFLKIINQGIKLNEEIAVHEVHNKEFAEQLRDRLGSATWTGLPAVKRVSKVAFVPFEEKIKAIKLPSAIESALSVEEANRLRFDVFCQYHHTNMGEHLERRKFRQTKTALLKLQIAAILYHRANGTWPTDFAQLSPSIISPDDFKNKTGLFSTDEIFHPLIMKTVSLVPDEKNPHPISVDVDDETDRYLIQELEPLLLGDHLVYKRNDKTNYNVKYTEISENFLIGTLNINNRNVMGNYLNFNPILIQAMEYILETDKKNLVKLVNVERMRNPIQNLSNNPSNIQETVPLTEQQIAEDQKAFDEFSKFYQEQPYRSNLSQALIERIQENQYLIKMEVELPRRVFAIYSVGMDGEDNGGVRNYRYNGDPKKVKGDIVTYLFPPE